MKQDLHLIHSSPDSSVATAYVSGVAALFLSDPELNITKVDDLYKMLQVSASTYSVNLNGQPNTTQSILYNQPYGSAP